MTASHISSAERIHRFFHRLGVVVAAIVLLAAGAVAAEWVSSWTRGPRVATQLSDVYTYGDEQIGTFVKHADGNFEPLDKLISQQNSVYLESYHRNLEHNGNLVLAFGVGSIGIYILLRAIGWVFAGAAKS